MRSPKFLALRCTAPPSKSRLQHHALSVPQRTPPPHPLPPDLHHSARLGGEHAALCLRSRYALL
eukprot:5768256-Pleurochrysis_carterae.AAC.1